MRCDGRSAFPERQHAGTGSSRRLSHHGPDLHGEANGSPLVTLQHPADLFPEGLPGASAVATGEVAYLHVHHHRPPVDREIGHGPLAPRMDAGGLDGTSRARDRHLPAAGPHPDPLALVCHIVDDQAGQAREHHTDKPAALDHALA